MDRSPKSKTELLVMQAEEAMTSIPTVLQNQLVATKFFVPVASGPLICRPRLAGLLDESLKRPLTLVSAPAGFGKTTLAASWAQSLAAKQVQVAWISLDEEDNDPQLFWSYVLTALQIPRPERFSPLLAQLQSPQAPPLKSLLIALINLLAESTEQLVLILDDYHLIINQEIHNALVYLVEHIPPQLRIFMLTRADPSWPLSQLRARQQVLEVRASQLGCTAEETKAFFKEVVGIQLPDEMIQEVTARTEGWLVGLQLLGLSLPEDANSLKLLEEASGKQRYILDYLTEEVLRRQPQEVQTFLLSTCILERLTASLCDAVMEQTGSQQMLERLERANLFVVSLDNKREWSRYHVLFAEALHSQLERAHADLVPVLHVRASRWYAQHQQTTQSILHAFRAQEWHWAADLIEREHLPLLSFAWGTGRHAQVLLRQWLEQLPAGIMSCRPRLCLSCFQMLWTVTPQPLLHIWLDAAEVTLMASLKTQTQGENSQSLLRSEARQEQRDLLGEVLTDRAFLWSYTEDGQAALPLCDQALALLSAENTIMRAFVAITQLIAYYASSANDVVAAVECGLQAALLAQAVGNPAYTVSVMGVASLYMIGAGRLHEAKRLTQQAILRGTQPAGSRLPDVGYPAVLQAEILREWNDLDAARSLVTEGISLYEQATSLLSLIYFFAEYMVLVRVCLSCGELDAACSALQQLERLGRNMNQSWYLYAHSLFTTIDQVRLWLACGELDCATRWAEELEMTERHLTPFAHEREGVACARIFLAKDQPTQALQRLEPVFQRATAGQRWGHVIEIRLLQALAHQRLHEEPQALAALSEAVCLGEPEGYMRSFLDEGPPMAALLSKWRERQRTTGPTPYLDRVLAAFPQQNRMPASQSRRDAGHTLVQPLREPLSERELQVLKLIACGASNQEIGQELVIVIDTVKRHVSHIFAKLGVQNRVQAVRRAQEHGLLDEED